MAAGCRSSVLCSLLALLIFASQSSDARPVTYCRSGETDEVALQGADDSVFVSLPGPRRYAQRLLECELRPGAKLHQSLVFQRCNVRNALATYGYPCRQCQRMLWLGRKRPERDEQELVRVRAQVLELSHNYAYRRAKYMYMYSYTKNVRRRGTIPPLPPNAPNNAWLEFSLPPMVLLEVVCTVHESVQQENAKTPLIVCARCDRNKESKEKDVEHNGTLVDVGHDPTFGETGEDLGASGSLSRRLRRSAASLLHSAKSRHWAKVAVVVSVLFSLVAGVLLVALCAGKSKSKESPAQHMQEGEGSAQAGDRDQGVTTGTGETLATTTTDGVTATPEVAASVENRDKAVTPPRDSPDGQSASAAVENEGERASTQPSTSPGSGAAGIPASPASGSENAEQARQEAPSPPYASIMKPSDDTIEESGDGVVVHDGEDADQSVSYAYARVNPHVVVAARAAASSTDAQGEGAANSIEDDEDGPSYEKVIATPPSHLAPTSQTVVNRARASSERSAASSERHDSKSSTLGRSLPDPVGTPAFLVPPAKVKLPLSPGTIEEENDPTYSIVDEDKRKKRVSDPYAKVDDDFRTKMKRSVKPGDSPYARAFDDISELETEKPYSQVAGLAISPVRSSPDSGLDNESGDHPYDNVFDYAKAGKKKPAEEEKKLDSPYAQPNKPGSAQSPSEAPVATTSADESPEPVSDALYAMPNKGKGQSTASVTEKIYEEPPELAPRGPEASVLESAVKHYEVGKEDEPVEGLPAHTGAVVYAMPDKGKLDKEQPPTLQPRTEASNELLPASPQSQLDGAGYASVKGEELDEARRKLDNKEGGWQSRQQSLASVGSQPENEDGIATDHLYSAVSEDDLDGARRKLGSPTVPVPPAPEVPVPVKGGKSGKHHGYSKVSDKVLAKPKDPDATVGDPGYMEVDANLKETLVRIRAETGDSPSPALPRDVSRNRAKTSRPLDPLPPAVPQSQRPRAATMDVLRSANEKDILKIKTKV